MDMTARALQDRLNELEKREILEPYNDGFLITLLGFIVVIGVATLAIITP